MSDRIEIMLSSALQDVTRHLTEARRNVVVLELDANRIERLLAIHLQMKEDEDPPTQAFPAAPPAAPVHTDQVGGSRISADWTNHPANEAGPVPLPVTLAACERCIEPVPAFARVVVASTKGKAVLDQVLCAEHTQAERETGQIGMATVTVHPLTAPPAAPAVTLTDPQDATPKDGA